MWNQMLVKLGETNVQIAQMKKSYKLEGIQTNKGYCFTPCNISLSIPTIHGIYI